MKFVISRISYAGLLSLSLLLLSFIFSALHSTTANAADASGFLSACDSTTYVMPTDWQTKISATHSDWNSATSSVMIVRYGGWTNTSKMVVLVVNNEGNINSALGFPPASPVYSGFSGKYDQIMMYHFNYSGDNTSWLENNSSGTGYASEYDFANAIDAPVVTDFGNAMTQYQQINNGQDPWCVVQTKNVGYTGEVDPTVLPAYDPVTQASSDVTLTPRFTVTGSYQNFIASNTGFETSPVTDGIAHPTSLIWSVVDLSDPCNPGDPRPECTFAGLGYLDVCQSMSVSVADTYTYATGCNGYTFNSSHHYAITSGYTYGLGEDDTTYPGLHIIFKTAMYSIPFGSGSYSLNTQSCTTTTSAGDYGVGLTCNGFASVVCSTLLNFVSQMTCQLQKSLDFGVINPSLQALVGLVSSIIVPTNPTCSLPLGDITLSPGKVFPVSTFGTHICDSATQLRTAFPIAVVLVNFIFAIGFITLVVRLINRLLNKDDNNLIVSA